MKLVFRINLLFAAIVSAIVLTLGTLIFTFSRQSIRQDFRERIKTRAARTAQLYSFFKTDTTGFLKSLDATAPPALFNKNIHIYSPEGHILYEYTDPETPPMQPDSQKLADVPAKGTSFYREGAKEVCLYYHNVPGNYFTVLVSAENITGNEFIRNLRKIFLLFVPGAMIVALLAGYLFSRSLIRPIRDTIRDVELISSQNLSHRLYEGTRKDELAQLNATFNNLLNRLEESFAIQRRFISNASHELSTPLTSVSSQIEVALLQSRSNEEYRAVLRSVLEDVMELQQLTRNLLEIAKAGTDGAISLESIRLDEVLIKAHSDVMRQHRNYHPELAMEELPDNEEECTVFGNFHLLYSAFRNLLENGCKYSPDSTVRVSVAFRGAAAEITVANKSDLLSQEEINRLFEPFYRGQNATAKPGTGLGLTLTRRIISIHKGQIQVTSHPDNGTRILISLPTLQKKSF